MKVQERVRRFILEELNWDRPAADLTDEFPLLESGAVDSMGVFNLVSFLEEEYGVHIPDQDLVPENFGTIGGIARLLDSRKAP
jgi:acyl carrier protein